MYAICIPHMSCSFSNVNICIQKNRKLSTFSHFVLLINESESKSLCIPVLNIQPSVAVLRDGVLNNIFNKMFLLK